MKRRNFLMGGLAGLIGSVATGKATPTEAAAVATPKPGEPGSTLQWAELPVADPAPANYTSTLFVRYYRQGDLVHGHVDGYEHIWGMANTLEELLRQINLQVNSLNDNLVTLSWFSEYRTSHELWLGHKLTRDEREHLVEISLEQPVLIAPLNDWQRDMSVCLFAAPQVYTTTPTDLMANTHESKQHRLCSNLVSVIYPIGVNELGSLRDPLLTRKYAYWRGCAETSSQKNFVPGGPADQGTYSYCGRLEHAYARGYHNTAYPRRYDLALPVNYLTMPALLDRLSCPRVISAIKQPIALSHERLHKLQADLWRYVRERLTSRGNLPIRSRYLSLPEVFFNQPVASSHDVAVHVRLVSADEPFIKHFHDGECVSS